ncbi:MAG: HisA/HisF-related TIM barrel protein [Bacteroidota bacterium]
MQITPALYIKEGKASAFHPAGFSLVSFTEKDPYELISDMDEIGIRKIHLVDADINASNGGNTGLIGSLANTAVMDLQVGGGITDLQHIKSLQYAGVDQFVLGSVVIDNFEFVKEIGESDDVPNEKIVIGLDLIEGQLTCHGWQDIVTSITLHQLIYKCINAGFTHFLVSEISRMIFEYGGPNLSLYENLTKDFPGASIAASGQIFSFSDIHKLEEVGVEEVVIGDNIFREPNLLHQIKAFNDERRKGD